MSGRRRTNQSDPTAERTADQSTQSAGGIGDQPGHDTDPGEDVFNRNEEVRYDTPRRYEEDDERPLTPGEDRH